MYINYKLKDGIEYAMVVTSVRKGASVTKEKPLYLGRVIDKEHGIFKNRVRGIYNLNSALNYNEEGTGTFILNALKIAL